MQNANCDQTDKGEQIFQGDQTQTDRDYSPLQGCDCTLDRFTIRTSVEFLGEHYIFDGGFHSSTHPKKW